MANEAVTARSLSGAVRATASVVLVNIGLVPSPAVFSLCEPTEQCGTMSPHGET